MLFRSGTPPPKGWQHVGGAALQRWVDALPHPAVVEEASGRGTIEAYTIVHGRDGGAVIGRLVDGRRFLAVVRAERAVLEAMEREEQVGRVGRVSSTGGVSRYEPV